MMRKTALLTGIGLIFGGVEAFAAIDCATLPSCADLGYGDDTSICPDKYLPCPFDKTKGICLLNAQPGQISYFMKDPGKGWLKCDGNFYHKEAYPDLYAAIGITAGGSGSVFQVPDYAGDFLRIYGRDSGSLNYRQAESLPNLYGTFKMGSLEEWGSPIYAHTGVFYSSTYYGPSGSSQAASPNSSWPYSLTAFSASNYNPIYAGSHVVPVNSAVYAFIYAGRHDSSKGTAASQASSCTKGNYFYTDGTCSSSYSSSKTVKGIVYSVSKYTNYTYLTYVYGGYYTYSTGTTASAQCESKGGKIASTTYFTSLPTNISTAQSVVRSVQSGQYYWTSTSSKYKCTSASSCSYSSDSNSASYYCWQSTYLY